MSHGAETPHLGFPLATYALRIRFSWCEKEKENGRNEKEKERKKERKRQVGKDNVRLIFVPLEEPLSHPKKGARVELE